MTGGLAYILDEDDTLIPKVCILNLFAVLIDLVRIWLVKPSKVQ